MFLVSPRPSSHVGQPGDDNRPTFVHDSLWLSARQTGFQGVVSCLRLTPTTPSLQRVYLWWAPSRQLLCLLHLMPPPTSTLFRRIGILFQRARTTHFSVFKTPSASPPPALQVKMSSAGAATAATLYAIASISTPNGGTKPEDATEKKHHLKNGKGFWNPWPSYKEASPAKIIWEMLW